MLHVICHMALSKWHVSCVMCHMAHIIWPHLHDAPSAMKVQGGWIRWLQHAWWLIENTKKILLLFSFFFWKPTKNVFFFIHELSPPKKKFCWGDITWTLWHDWIRPVQCSGLIEWIQACCAGCKADPSRCNFTGKQNPPIQQNRRNFLTNTAI